MRATYSPDDNKLRLYPVARLDADEYARVKAAGFRWAGRQELFVAPAWTPDREDLLVELCGDVEDEDTSLVERAEERSDAFAGYADNRRADAEQAQRAVSAIADGIPFGQPILVGHHSERHARKDAERIRSGMQRVVDHFKTSQYWTARAAGAMRNAKYKERPDVRHRRIKGLVADLKKVQASTRQADTAVAMWTSQEHALTRERALAIANHDHISKCFTLAEYPRVDGASTYEGMMGLWSALDGRIITPAQARDIAVRVHTRGNAHRARWIAHLENRLAYERAMLAEAGGLVTDRVEHPIQVGGRVLCGGEWLLVKKVNRSSSGIVSVSVIGGNRWTQIRGIETIKDYQPPTAEDCIAVDARKKLPPIINVRGDGIREMTAAEFKARTRASDFAGIARAQATETHGAYRYRRVPGSPYWNTVQVFLTDAKVVEKPGPVVAPPPVERILEASAPRQEQTAPPPTDPLAETVAALQGSLTAGVAVVSAPQLFPTPVELARRMVDAAQIAPEHLVLEPSAGTGRLLDAILERHPQRLTITAIEQNIALADGLNRRYYPGVAVGCLDFLDFASALQYFDRIVMNPPFINGADIKHIEHARAMLAPDGILVALCANGPRQQAKYRDCGESNVQWIDLPEGSFREAGTDVRVAMIIITGGAL